MRVGFLLTLVSVGCYFGLSLKNGFGGKSSKLFRAPNIELDNEYSIFSFATTNGQPTSGEKKDASTQLLKEREQLYEAYNLLHTLAQVLCHF
jgi:hypothetical protein